MAEELPPGTPEVDDPLLLADLIRLLSVKGALGKMQVADIVLPVVSLGDVVQPTVEVRQAAFRSTDIFSAGMQTAPAANTVLADTTALVAGTYDVKVLLSAAVGASNTERITLEHRDAANAANLATWDSIMFDAGQDAVLLEYNFGYVFGFNERLRAINPLIVGAGQTVNAVIFARLR